MKSKNNLLVQLNRLPHFTKTSVQELGGQLGLEDRTIEIYISRFLKHRDIYRLKNGLYVSAHFFDTNRSDLSYSFYLANVLRTPSYVSSWSALQYYGLATEAIRSVTSVTPKVTRKYETRAGTFAYQSIRKDLFSDFILVKGKFDFFVARPAKALFDLLYFRTKQFRGLSREAVPAFIDELRIDVDEMEKKEQERFYSLVNAYLHE